MKSIKWAIAIIAVVAVIVVVLHLRRDSLALDIANSMLSDQDLTVTDLSVEELSTNRLVLDQVILENSNGSRYVVQGLSLPLSVTGKPEFAATAESISADFAANVTERASLVEALRTILSLPATRPMLSATVDRIRLPGIPELTDVNWRIAENRQHLSLSTSDIALSIDLIPAGDREHHLLISGAAGNEEILAVDLNMSDDIAGGSIEGTLMLRLARWLPFLQEIGVAPAGLESLDAEYQGPISARLDYGAAGNLRIDSRLELTETLGATYETAGAQTTSIEFDTMETLLVTYAYPARTWSAESQRVTGTLVTDGLTEIPVTLGRLTCRSGIECQLQASIDAPNVRWFDYTIDRVELDIPVQLTIADDSTVQIAPDSEGTFTGVAADGLIAEQVLITHYSGTKVVVGETDWRSTTEQIDLEIEGITVGNDLSLALPISLGNLRSWDAGEAIETAISVDSRISAQWGGIDLALPGVQGLYSRRGDVINSVLSITDVYSAMAGTIHLAQELSAGSGSLRITDASLDFRLSSLTDFVPKPPFPVEIAYGKLIPGISLAWEETDAGISINGQVLFALQDLGGSYRDNAFVGLDTEVSARIDTVTGTEIAPASLSLRLAEVGLPVENISFDYQIDLDSNAVGIEQLRLDLLGGAVAADDFTYSLGGETSLVMLQATGIQLQLMVDILEFDDLAMTGAVSGVLPVKLSNEGITIADGRMESEAAGGVIRYASGDATLSPGVLGSLPDVVTQALKNFKFDSLTSAVEYDNVGDLVLQMRLSGVNPDVDPTQPIIFNLGVENNVPEMLRSLRAIRSIEDILEQRTAN